MARTNKPTSFRVTLYGLCQMTVKATSVKDAAAKAIRRLTDEIDAGQRERPAGLPLCTGVYDYAAKKGWMMLTEHAVQDAGLLGGPDGSPPPGFAAASRKGEARP